MDHIVPMKYVSIQVKDEQTTGQDSGMSHIQNNTFQK